MSEISKRTFLVLTICGTLCMLAGFGTLAYLYHLHAESFTQAGSAGETSVMMFTFCVGLPSVAIFIAGGSLVVFGIRSVLKDDSL